MPRRVTASRWTVAGACAAAAAGVAWLLLAPRAPAPAPESSPAPPPPVAAPAPPDAEVPEAMPLPADDGAPLELTIRDSSIPWGVVDLEEVRAALPRNRYFEMAIPTEDLRVIQQREDERARWNVEYGKVLSGTGSEPEIQAYYEHRQRLSADYVEFVSYLLDHYGDRIPERDVGLLELARRLHLARLQEIPRQIQVALDRKRAQDEARAAWLADEAAFDAPSEPD
jgi:hypothetical protein